MKNSILMHAVLALFSVAAQASTRVDSGFGVSYSSRSEACIVAKRSLQNRVATGVGERLVSIGACDCDQNKLKTWSCNVSGRIASKDEDKDMDRMQEYSDDDGPPLVARPLEQGIYKGTR